MMRVLFSTEVLLELVLERKFLEKKTYRFLEPENSQEIEAIRVMVESGKELLVCVPPALLLAVNRLLIRYTDGDQTRVKRSVDEIINIIRCSYLSCHPSFREDSLSEEASAIYQLSNYPQNADMEEVLYLLFTKALLLDAIVTRQPDKFKQITNLNSPELSGFEGKILTPSEFIVHVREFQDLDEEGVNKIKVYTPQNKLIELYRHEKLSHCITPLDFAYALYEDFGHKCSGAKVNGKEVHLDYCLKSEDRVELKKEGNGPSQEWLNMVGTNRAHKKIEYWFRVQDIKKGWAILEEKKLGKKVGEVRNSPELLDIVRKIAAKHKYQTADELVKAIGSDNTNTNGIENIERIIEEIRKQMEKMEAQVKRGKKVLERKLSMNVDDSSHKKKLQAMATKLKCRNQNELFAKVGANKVSEKQLKELGQESDSPSWQIARCCHPLPGDGESIVTVAKPGSLIRRIHRSDCENIEHLDPKHVRSIPREQLNELWQELDGFSWQIANCCRPLPGDGESIVMIGSRIHRSDCKNIEHLDPKRARSISWYWNHCIAVLYIKTHDWPGTFQTVLEELAKEQIWVDVRSVSNHGDKTSKVNLLVPVTSKKELAQIKNQVENLPGILKVEWTRITPAINGWCCEWSCALSDKPEFESKTQVISTLQ